MTSKSGRETQLSVFGMLIADAGDPENCDRWLDPSLSDVEVIQAMVQPFPERLMEAYPVGPKVGSPDSDGPEQVDQRSQSEGASGQGTLEFRTGSSSVALWCSVPEDDKPCADIART